MPWPAGRLSSSRHRRWHPGEACARSAAEFHPGPPMPGLAQPIVLGNWKMHGLRAEAEALVAALAARKAAPAARDARRFPAGDGARGGGGTAARAPASGSAPRTATSATRALHRLDQRPDAAGRRRRGRDRRPLGAAARPRRDGDRVRAKAEAALACGLGSSVIGETEAEWLAGKTLSAWRASSPPACRARRRQPLDRRLRAGMGHRHRTECRQRRHRAQPRASARPAESHMVGGDAVPILYGGSVKPATRPRSWPCPASTASWSAAPAWRRRASGRSSAAGGGA